MKRNVDLSKRLQEVLLDGRWIANTNYKAQISSISWEKATQKVGSLNTIAALTFHINYYLAGILNVFDGGNLDIRDQFSFDAPPITNQRDWDQLVNDFIMNSEKFVAHVKVMSNEKLDEPFVNVKYGSYQRNIEGVIEHSYYHLGQISLVRKMILEEENK